MLMTRLNPIPTKTTIPQMVPSDAMVWLLALLLAVGTIALYWPAIYCGFAYDDAGYITANAAVQKGITWDNLKLAFASPMNLNWHPVTILSHMLDCELFGLKAWGHHLTSLLFHALDSVLVFIFLRNITGLIWRSFIVATLFSVHPLHVESVAWVAERKDVLSTGFGLISLIFYVRCVRKRSIPIQFQAALPYFLKSTDYWISLSFLGLGLMSKPMLVTWPFVMLLLDYWPLARGSFFARRWLLVWEKIPFFALVMVFSVVTFLVQKNSGAVVVFEERPLGLRIANVLVSYCSYLGKLGWPVDLAAFYQFPLGYPLWQVLSAGGVLLLVSVILFWRHQKQPFLLMGWLWFLGTLVPVNSLVQVGEQAMADRYTYIPSIGIFVLVVWGLGELVGRWRPMLIPLIVVGLVALAMCIVKTRRQIAYWQDDETLFRHALAVTNNNLIAHQNLGIALYQKGRLDEAASQFQEVLLLNIKNYPAHNYLGVIWFQNKQVTAAVAEYQEAIRLNPQYADAHYNLGVAYLKAAQTDQAVNEFQSALRLKPEYAEAHFNLGMAYFKRAEIDAAISEFQAALHDEPDFAEACYNLGVALGLKGQTAAAISQYRMAINLKPEHVEAHYNLGNALFKQGDLAAAASEYRTVVRLQASHADAHNNLGIVLFQSREIQGAIAEFQTAIRIKPDFAQARTNLARALGAKTFHQIIEH